MDEKITIISKFIQSRDEEVFLLCNMSDGSQWQCDMQGKNWKKVIVSDNELNDLFNSRP